MKEIVSQFNMVGFTPEQYERVTKDMEAAGKENYSARRVHIAAQTANGLLITDVWESEDALNKFSETLIPILARHGVTPSEPTLLPLLNMMENEPVGSNIDQANFVI